MFRIIAVIVFAGGVLVKAQAEPDCVRQEDVATLNVTAAALEVSLGSMLGENPSIDEIHKVLNMTCNDKTTRAAVDQIQRLIASCILLIEASEIKNLNIGNLKFIDLFEKFSGVDNYCECVPSLVGVMQLQGIEASMKHSDMVAAYKDVTNFPFMCTPMTANFPVNISGILTTLKDNVQTCSNVFDYNTIFKKSNIVQASALVGKCNAKAEDNFMCAMNVSKTGEFKLCITKADALTSTDMKDLQCERRECADLIKKDCSEEASEVYMWSVEVMNAGRFRLVEDCSAATTATVTILLLVSAVIYSIFFAN